MQLFSLLLKIGLLYFMVVIIYRLMNKRQMSELSIMDLAVFLMLSGIITSILISNNIPLIYIVISIGFLIILNNIMILVSNRVPALRYIFECKPSLIISKGRLNYKEMIKRRYKLDNLLNQLHDKGIKNIEEVEYAFLDDMGRLSTYKYQTENNNIPLPVILDGQIQYITLKLLHKSGEWLKDIIIKEKVDLKDIFYAFYKQDKLYIIKNDQ